jgi:hypothetical protein
MTGHQHHVHGSLDGVHLAPESTVTISVPAHDREHAIRRGLRLDRGARAKTPAERVELQLRRRAVFEGSTLARQAPEGALRQWILMIAEDDVRLADELAGIGAGT